MIPVTKPFLPPIEEYMAHVQRAYNNEWLTNRGELVKELEEKIQIYLGSLSKPILMNNGTVPLQIALKLLGCGGEVITTPFSYVATTSTIVWEGCTPVFVDIDPVYWTIDETKIEEAITEKTTCILATHVFGNPCNVEEIERIAKKHKLYVIYDAAHCFGVKYKGKSIFDWGDISTCSFHATKIFHTGEGGAAFVNNKKLHDEVFYSHNFGHIDSYSFFKFGINAKMSELQAAMGLVVLDYMDRIILNRRETTDYYLNGLNGRVCFQKIREETQVNYSYFVLKANSETTRTNIELELSKKLISSRRYFYPSLDLLYFQLEKAKDIQTLQTSKDLSDKVLSLPLYWELNREIVHTIISTVL